MTLFRTERTLPVDIAWYRGIPLWTDSATRGVTFLHGHRGVSPASANILHFENPTGIHVYHGNIDDNSKPVSPFSNLPLHMVYKGLGGGLRSEQNSLLLFIYIHIHITTLKLS